jgi:hypothetical protein
MDGYGPIIFTFSQGVPDVTLAGVQVPDIMQILGFSGYIRIQFLQIRKMFPFPQLYFLSQRPGFCFSRYVVFNGIDNITASGIFLGEQGNSQQDKEKT